MSEPWPENPLLVEVYDVECAGRWDHDFYLALAEELGAGSVVDIGCGTGVFAVDAAARGLTATGVDPAAAILERARTRPGGDTVTWIHGGPDLVPAASADLAIMMGHVAQYFVADDDWAEVLNQTHRFLAPGGHLAFETRNPAVDWAGRWTRDRTETTYAHPRGGEFVAWVEVQEVTGPADSYTQTHQGNTVLPDGRHLQTLESLRFRNADQVFGSLDLAGFDVVETWGDWDRAPVGPDSRELIVLARRRDRAEDLPASQPPGA